MGANHASERAKKKEKRRKKHEQRLKIGRYAEKPAKEKKSEG